MILMIYKTKNEKSSIPCFYKMKNEFLYNDYIIAYIPYL